MSPKRAAPTHVNACEDADANEALAAVVAAVKENGAAEWPRFLREYSSFILTCIRRYAMDEDERMDIYVHVCKRLSADDCRRLRQFRGHGPRGSCKFTTWLAAVVLNLAREWIRTARGRRRLFRSIRDLDRTDRLIFKYYFWEGYTRKEIATLLSSRDRRSLSVADVCQRLESIERQLSKDHRWRLVTSLLRSGGPVSLDRPPSLVGDGLPIELAAEGPDGLAAMQRSEARALLHRLIADLPKEQRLALRLRFERGLTAREVAAVLGIRNYKRVYEIQGKALSKLADELRARGVELRDFIAPRANAERTGS